MKKLGLILSFIFLALSAGAKPKYGNFEKHVNIPDVGELKVIYKFFGEPIARPRAFSIYVKCAGKKEFDPVGQYQMCELSNYEIDVKAKKLTIDYVDARVEPTTGVATCDQRGHGDLPLADICK